MMFQVNRLWILGAIIDAINMEGIYPLEIDPVNLYAGMTVTGDDSEAYCLHSS